MSALPPLRIAIDARMDDRWTSGIKQVVIGLAGGFSRLADDHEEYHFLALPGQDAWLRPHLHGPCRALYVEPAPPPSPARSLLNRIPGARRAWETLSPLLLGRKSFTIPESDGTIETSRIDLMHFTLGSGFRTSVPSIYHPHDLQHRHIPAAFSPRQRMARDILYRALCEQAAMVAVVSTWVKNDLMHEYGLDESKIAVVPFAPVLDLYRAPADEDLPGVAAKFNLPADFILYPAVTYPHKNHRGLLDALAILNREQNLRVPLVACGCHDPYIAQLRKHCDKLGLAGQVHFIGVVTGEELRSLYRLCRAVVVPSLFEAASFPVWEAFESGAPVACSNVTSLPAQAGDAAIIFDPRDAHMIAQAIRRLWIDPALRADLIAKGRASAARFTWERTARLFRAHYRRLAARPLTDADAELLAAPPLL